MIHLGNQEQIDSVRKAKRSQITAHYKNPAIEKAISVDDFNKEYSEDKYDRWSQASMNKFVEDFKKSEDFDEESGADDLMKSFDGIIRVAVTDGKKVQNIFVREKDESLTKSEDDESEDEEEGEGEED